MELFLYVCECCGYAKFKDTDCGTITYDSCAGCREFSYHQKVVIRKNVSLFMDEHIFKLAREEKDDNSDTGTDKEA